MNRLNEENYNSCGTLMKIVEYTTADNIIVEFQDEYKFRKKTQYVNFKTGRVKNPYDKIVYNVACIGSGKYGTWKDHRNSKGTYKAWLNMLQRCYVDVNGKYASYYGIVKVCEEWLDLQNFAEWYESNYGEEVELCSLKITLPANFPISYNDAVPYECYSYDVIESKYIEFLKEE